MKTLVIGAAGKIGRLFCGRAQRSGRPIRAMVRSEEQLAHFVSQGIECVLGDLENDFFAAFEGCHRVVFTAGSGGHTGGDKTLLVDLYGALRSIEEAERRDVEHFLMVSALRADEPLAGPPAMRHYFVAKKLADDRLRQGRVPYTILRPGRLTDDEPGSGRVCTEIGADGGFSISRDNVAACVEVALDSPAARGQVVDLVDGETPVAELFRPGG
jgi:uncharacterized protein YbjT (DUF2867 family)